jgi:processing peptidase subunit beta
MHCAKILNKVMLVALDILVDILQNSCFLEDQIDRESDVILKEMKEVEGQAEEVIFDHLDAITFHYSLSRVLICAMY